MSDTPPFRSGYVSLVGWPNVGKSTLLNTILGTKLSIVSPRPQTTRESVLGILNWTNTQMVFVDTPGWLKPQDTFQSFMKRAVIRAIYDDADVLAWVLEPRLLGEEEMTFGKMLLKPGKPVVAIINKSDRGAPPDGWGKMEEQIREATGADTTILRVSARKGDGVEMVKNKLASLLPESPAYFPTDQITDRWERFYVAELIREQLFLQYQEEVPHAAAVAVEEFIEQEGKKDHIKVVIYVETEGQLGIVVGNKGHAIKSLGQAAREEIELRIGRPIHLETSVKVHKNWRKDVDFLRKVQSNYPEGLS